MKKISVKIISLLLTLIMITGFCLCAFADDETVVSGTFSASGTTFGSSSRLTLTNCDGSALKFDYRWLTTYKQGSYNKGLATIASLISTDIYDDCTVSTTSKTDNANGHVLLDDLGFADTKLVSLSADDYEVDKNDLTSVSLGHRVITIDNFEYNIFVACVSGTRGTQSDWFSNYDVGYDGEDYYEISSIGSSHPDWVNKERHKGFDVAATRIKRVIDAYIDENTVSEAENSILLTGHSRGASIANILGTYYEDAGDIRSYTYTFACPATTTESESITGCYSTIFNLINEDDFTSVMPLKEWGFKRYGTDVTLKVSENAELKNAVNSLQTDSGYAYCDVTELSKEFAKLAPTRADVYKTITISEDYPLSAVLRPSAEASTTNHIFYSAKSYLNTGKDYVGTSDLFNFEIKENGIEKAKNDNVPVGSITVNFKPAFVIEGLAKIMANRNDFMAVFMTFIGNVGYANLTVGYEDQIKYYNDSSSVDIPAMNVLMFLYSNSSNLTAPHLCSTFYAMTLFTEDKAEEEGSMIIPQPVDDDDDGDGTDDGTDDGDGDILAPILAFFSSLFEKLKKILLMITPPIIVEIFELFI